MTNVNEGPMVSVTFNKTSHFITSKPIFQYDYGLTLSVKGLDDLNVGQIHFANSDTGRAINILAGVGSSGEITAQIPDTLSIQGKDIYAFLYVEDESCGYTVRTVKIPVTPRAKPEVISMDSPSMGPLNEQTAVLNALIEEVESLKTSVTQAIAAANTATSNANTATTNAANATSSANSAAQNAQKAADKLNSISFDVNPDDSCLYMHTTS